MNRISKKGKKYLVLLVLLVLLVGCTKIVGEDGKTLPEKIIYTTTTFSDMFENDSWFSALIVYPIAQVINFLSPVTGVVAAIILCTVLVNVLTLPLSLNSAISTQKMQMIQPDIEKINKKYENRKDESAQLRQAQEIQSLYKKHGINPLGTILGTFVSLPILIGMYNAVQRANAVATAFFMGVDLQLSPVSNLKLGGRAAIVALIIYLCMAASQYLSMQAPKWLANKKNREDRKIRDYDGSTKTNSGNTMQTSMIFVIIFLGATLPTAMSVYWFASSSINVAKTYFIQTLAINNKGKK